jgi:DNA-binding transcriptional LysR family regulator
MVSELRSPIAPASHHRLLSFRVPSTPHCRLNLARLEIDVRHVISDSFTTSPAAGCDILIRYGTGRLPGYVGHKLFDDELIAACSPAYLSAAAADHARRSPERVADPPGECRPDLGGLELLVQPSGRHRGTVDSRQLINNYIIAVQAAVDGIGIVLMKRLLTNHLKQGLLVPAIEAMVLTTGATTRRSAAPAHRRQCRPPAEVDREGSRGDQKVASPPPRPVLRWLGAVGDAGAAIGVVEFPAVVAVVLLGGVDLRLPIPGLDAAFH